MTFKILLIVSLQNVLTNSYMHQKPLHNTLWSERCKRHDVVLNDCNWCWCNDRQRYHCEARVCEEIDMFGHFKDAIQDIDVGMEGHGVWRSSPTSCSPGVQYRRGSVLCVCNEDGNWPNPVCRDILRVLYSVEPTSLTHPTANYACSPTKLYLVGCNVCFCPSKGSLDPTLCTQNTCHRDDPILQANITSIARTDQPDNENLEIYAYCKPNVMYTIGCMSCKCLKNNRLVCETCPQNKNSAPRIRKDSENDCRVIKTDKIFEKDCNLCYCDVKHRRICTVRKCLRHDSVSIVNVSKNTDSFIQTTPPIDDEDCTPGTWYNKDCSICKCMKLSNGKKIIQCTMKFCNETSSKDIIKTDCVVNSAYERNCMLCYCEKRNGEKIQSCYTKTRCQGTENRTLSKLHGYCEPLSTYKHDCNQCRCLIDGETLLCTTKTCPKGKQERKLPVTVEIVPIKRNEVDVCPRGQSFKIKCNICFCLANNNAMCTTNQCSKN